MTNHTPVAPVANTNQLSDEYVNAVTQRHGYQSPEAVIARLNQWIGLHGGEDSVTLLMYEAHKALSKLRAAAVPNAQPAFWIDLEPISGSQNLLIRQWHNLGALGPGKHTLFLSPAALQASAPVADELPEWAQISAKASRGESLTALERFIFENEPGNDDDAWRDQLAAALASSRVAREASTRDRQVLREAIQRFGNARAMAEHNIAYRDEVRSAAEALFALLDAAPQASEAQCSCPSGDDPLRPPCAKHPKGSHHE